MGLFPEYLTEQDLEVLKDYNYNSGGLTYLDKKLDHFWNFVVKFVPRTIAPNFLTLGGTIIALSTACIVLKYAPTFTETVPTWVCFSFAFGCFVQQTLDAIDGKQARRTKSQSSLGTLFDHGCDILTSGSVAAAQLALIHQGLGKLTYLTLAISACLTQIILLWWEYHFYKFSSNFGYGIGVTEAQLLVITATICTGIFGSHFWNFDIFDCFPLFLKQFCQQALKLEMLKVNQITCVTVVAINLCQSTLLVLKGLFQLNSFSKKIAAFSKVLSFYLFFVFGWLFYNSLIQRKFVWPPVIVMTILFGYSIIGLRLLLAATSKKRYAILQWPVVPFYCVSVIFHECNQPSKRLPVFIINFFRQHCEFIVVIVCLLQLIYLTDLFITSTQQMSRYLNISCFIIQESDDKKN